MYNEFVILAVMSRVTEYTLPASWAPAMVQDNLQGMDEKDAIAMTHWVGKEKPGTFIRMDPASEPRFMRHHDARPFCGPCECLVFQFYESKKAQ